jgi:arabinogalactan oligomer/maltooligosaccharide transport system permease protein
MGARRAFAVLLVLALAVASALGLVACSEPPRGIVVWHPYRSGEEAALTESIRTFEAAHGVKVTVLAVPYEAYLPKLEAAIPRGNGPDLFVGPHNRLGEYRLHRLVAPVGDAFPDADVARYEPVTIDAVTTQGSRWAVPLASKCVALYYNTRLLEAAPRTLDEIVALKGKLGPGVWPLAYEAQSEYYHVALLHAYGATFFDEDEATGRGRYAVVGERAEASLAKARQLVQSGVVPDEASGDLVKQLFDAGKAATAFSGPWLAPDLSPDLPYAVAPLPEIEGIGTMRPFLTVDGIFTTPQGARSTDARALARWIGSSDSAVLRAEVGKQIVATTSYWDARKDERTVLDSFHRACTAAVPMPRSMAANPAWDPTKQALRKVLRGDASPKDALEEARARYDDVMKPAEQPSSSPFALVLGVLMLAAAFAIVRRVRQPGFGRELRAGVPAYRYVMHAAITIVVLVVLPLVAGAAMSFFTGTREESRFVGIANYVAILTARGKPLLSHGSFYLTLLVTVVWTLVNVVLHVGIGLVLGVALARPVLRLRAVYRVLLILPWAVPSYVTALVWKGMFHRQFGAVNALLVALGSAPISWFAKFSTAFAANIATNVWLGFPFMLVVVMGALTSISKDVLEAAEVDGASRWQTFRLVTLPLLRPTLLPAVVLGCIWTFNMFNVVFLVSGGEPDGTTDILVSEAYRWAFARNAQLGYAAAYAVIIFGLLVLMSRVLGRIGGGEEGSR